jgi:Fe-S-cluster containining protein
MTRAKGSFVSSGRRTSKKKPRRDQLKPGQCLCDFCTGKCCRYFSLPIDTPHSWDDFDSIRWYLAHGQTLVYVVKAQWYLLVKTRCTYLTRDNRCGIYLNRPKICRQYSTKDCEYDDDWSFTKIFETPEQIWEYAEAMLPPRRRRKPSPGPSLPVLSSPGAGGDLGG